MRRRARLARLRAIRKAKLRALKRAHKKHHHEEDDITEADIEELLTVRLKDGGRMLRNKITAAAKALHRLGRTRQAKVLGWEIHRWAWSPDCLRA